MPCGSAKPADCRAAKTFAVEQPDCRETQLEGQIAKPITAGDRILLDQFHPDQADKIAVGLRRGIAGRLCQRLEIQGASRVHDRPQQLQSDFNRLNPECFAASAVCLALLR